jgi:hypothetical protein
MKLYYMITILVLSMASSMEAAHKVKKQLKRHNVTLTQKTVIQKVESSAYNDSKIVTQATDANKLNTRERCDRCLEAAWQAFGVFGAIMILAFPEIFFKFPGQGQ